jgi:glutathione S-transferase
VYTVIDDLVTRKMALDWPLDHIKEGTVTMRLYQTTHAPNPRRVRMFLAEKGITDIEMIELDLQKGENITDEFKRKNPMGKVPVLELDDGTCISETVAICRYLEELQPAPSLMGRTPLEKATIEMWQRWAEFYFMLPTGMAFQHSTGFFKDRMNPISEWGEECKRNAPKFFPIMDARLAENEFLAGAHFSIADIIAFCTIPFGKAVIGLDIPEHCIHVRRWYEAIKTRPSAKA